MSFVDRVGVTFKAGDGGNGVVSFRHEKFRQLGGPDGGDGGNGGDIILVASNRENTLSNFRYKKLIKADNGGNGSRRKKRGKNANHLRLFVPVGTVILNNDQAIADLTHEGQEALIVRGGKGGYGNAHFVSSTRQAPRVAEKGERGGQIEAVLELKMIADVGIVGLPNAGKSTLLSVISNAKPTIANYPFTTLVPNLGVVDIDERSSLLFADIPGLIEGASHGKGLGDEFLRHIERTKVIIHLIDVYSNNLKRDYQTIMRELKDYKVDLSGRPQIVALTKVEGMAEKRLNNKIAMLKKIVPSKSPVLAISSQNRQGLAELLRLAWKLHKQKTSSKSKARKELPVIGLRESDESWQVSKDAKGDFIITGRKIERFAERTNFGDFYAEQRLKDILTKQGVIKELERQGIEPGQKIQIGQPTVGELEY